MNLRINLLIKVQEDSCHCFDKTERCFNVQPKNIFVSDLAVILLNSSHTARTINGMVENGMIFTYATERSTYTACPKTAKIKVRLPVIIYNGAFIVNINTGEIIHSNFFDKEQIEEIREV